MIRGRFWGSHLLSIMGYHILERGPGCQENPRQVDHKPRLDQGAVKAEEEHRASGNGRTGE